MISHQKLSLALHHCAAYLLHLLGSCAFIHLVRDLDRARQVLAVQSRSCHVDLNHTYSNDRPSHRYCSAQSLKHISKTRKHCHKSNCNHTESTNTAVANIHACSAHIATHKHRSSLKPTPISHQTYSQASHQIKVAQSSLAHLHRNMDRRGSRAGWSGSDGILRNSDNAPRRLDSPE